MGNNLNYLLLLINKILELTDDLESKHIIENTLKEIDDNKGNKTIINDSKIYIAVQICEEILKYKQKTKLIGSTPIELSIKYVGNDEVKHTEAYRYYVDSNKRSFVKPVIMQINSDVNISKLNYNFDIHSMKSLLMNIISNNIVVTVDKVGFITTGMIDDITYNSNLIHKAIKSENLIISTESLVSMINKFRLEAEKKFSSIISLNRFSYPYQVIDKSGIDKLISMNNIYYYLVERLGINYLETDINRAYLLIRDLSSDIDSFNREVYNSKSLTWLDNSDKAPDIFNKLQRLSETVFDKNNELNSKLIHIEGMIERYT